jgi:hypothetical protein
MSRRYKVSRRGHSRPTTPHEYAASLSHDDLLLVLEAAFQVYRDGNIYEWFMNTVDLTNEVADPVFGALSDFMVEV